VFGGTLNKTPSEYESVRLRRCGVRSATVKGGPYSPREDS